MAKHKNFFETIEEAKMRLNKSVVQYRDDFYYVVYVSDQKEDGKFRVYLDKLGQGQAIWHRTNFPQSPDYSSSELVAKYDSAIKNKSYGEGFIRKYATSRYFNKFRPFPMGNMNIDGEVIYCERSPTRNMNQGLLRDAVLATRVQTVPYQYDDHGQNNRLNDLSGRGPLGNAPFDIFSEEFNQMLKGEYPSYREVIENLQDPEILNNGCAFSREYSLFRGPLDMLFLCHRHSGVGAVSVDGKSLSLASTHRFLVEEITEMGIFNNITIKEVRGDKSNA